MTSQEGEDMPIHRCQETEEAENSGREEDPTLGPWVLGMSSGVLCISEVTETMNIL